MQRFASGRYEGEREEEFVENHRNRLVYLMFSTLESRISSYNQWSPSSKPNPNEMSEAGFFYMGSGDRTICYCCGGALQNWNKSHVPWEEHAIWFNQCRYLLHMKGGEFIKQVCTKPKTADHRSTTIIEGISLPHVGASISSGGSVVHEILDQGNFHREIERLKTFVGWRVPFLSAAQMASAGFYFTKKDDIVRCAFCGVEVGSWVEGDCPMVDHRRWSPTCRFLRNLPTDNVPINANDLISLQIQNQNVEGPKNTTQSQNVEGPTNSGSQTGIIKIILPKTVTKVEIFHSNSINTVSTTLKECSGKEQTIRDNRLCKICYIEEMGLYFQPCGHVVACVSCGELLKNCAVCRSYITNKLRVFLT